MKTKEEIEGKSKNLFYSLKDDGNHTEEDIEKITRTISLIRKNDLESLRDWVDITKSGQRDDELSDDLNRMWRREFEKRWKNGDFNYANISEISQNRVADYLAGVIFTMRQEIFSDLSSHLSEELKNLE